MAEWDDVRRVAMALPAAAESVAGDGTVRWQVKDKLFVWERPLRESDLAALGDDAPDGPILGARVADVGVKEALIAEDPAVYFTTPHFDGYPAVLVRLPEIAVAELDELITEAWLTRAPKRMTEEYLAGR
ncbi:MmcQ/YjbR family DNA-binding protein [Kibdelosporangium phytohabitans]|uniref:MmcQ/YjbR family DNA-binding protein n=1 Tax=Kibdelosporangium phytohabitans TaxID=860235 RepID=A0A0N9IAJ2_9PSEU|nr:MmcQ/YjbR family DNA-binding protein [Kibdelosporangium phytohabitans]ALG11787.1 hypothetical protein AOZ06_37330 [Kibdelosporangium phytohabitans]MBE1463196.1 hypothetical protein [Kibdelosporangium phytohabitans]